MAAVINSDTASFCYIDLDFNNYRQKLATAAAFVNACDTRYGFSSSDLRLLGGSEISRIEDLIQTDHEWSEKAASGVEVRPPLSGNRIVVKLFWDVAPLACENFATLCANGSALPGSTERKPKPAPIGDSGKPLTYRHSNVHRVVPGFVLQGGDMVFGNGSGGESIFGKKFKDERGGLNLKHDRKGVLSMGNSGKNSNTSQFFITFAPAPQCDGKHVIFGEVVSGWQVLDAAEQFGTSNGEPKVPIAVIDCGVWGSLQTPGAGYWYDQPDADSYTGVSPIFMVRPRVAVVAPSEAVWGRFQKALGAFCESTAVTADDASTESVARLCELLGNFAADIVLVAPACKDIISKIEVAKSWAIGETQIPIQQIVLEAKPLEASKVIRSKSWIAQQTPWQLDGMTQ